MLEVYVSEFRCSGYDEESPCGFRKPTGGQNSQTISYNLQKCECFSTMSCNKRVLELQLRGCGTLYRIDVSLVLDLVIVRLVLIYSRFSSSAITVMCKIDSCYHQIQEDTGIGFCCYSHCEITRDPLMI